MAKGIKKSCRSCGQTKSSAEFYAHPKTADGFMADCKECHKQKVQSNRAQHLERYREYDRERAMLPHRVEARERYASTKDGLARTRAAQAAWILRNKDRRAAHTLFGNAIKSGRIVRQPCEVCGSKNRIHGHHDDYGRQLDVRWLCPKHHTEHHKKLRGH